MRRVVVTGLGAVTPNGNSITESWENTLKGKSGIRIVKSFEESSFDVKIGGEVKDLDLPAFFSPKELKTYSRFTLLSILATREALSSAQLEPEDYLESNLGCFIGVGIGDVGTIGNTGRILGDKGPKKVSPFFIPYVISNMASGNTALFFRLRGPNLCVSTACASGTHAIGEAWHHIRGGSTDVIICGGSEAAMCDLSVVGFSRMNALSRRNDEPEKASRPFDKDRDGFVLGEGSGILVLEEYEHAKKRGAPILAELVGYGTSCDAYHITSPSPGGEGASRCMKAAIRSAAIEPKDIEYINAHGSSTYYNDMYETAAIKTVFKDDAKKLLVSSTKGATGHCLGATGGIEAAFVVKALREGLIPPTANLEEPGEGLDLDYVPKAAREKNIKYAMTNSFGFGGTNASLVFSTCS